MLYRNSKTKSLDENLFKNPTSEYRAAPFWAWNCELDENDLLWQIEQLKEMGFGGFFMHTRSGMSTKYLGDEFMRLVKSCTNKAQNENMYSYLYDEDRWPSGAAGGYVTKNYPEFRQRRLIFTENKKEVFPKKEAIKEGKTYLVGMFDIVLNTTGELAAYSLVEDEKDAKGIVRYAYCDVYSSFNKSPGWYNGGTYVDTLNKKAMEKFVEITHDAYKKAVGEHFGKTIPAIFTDEPQFTHYVNLPTPESKNDAVIPWTYDMDESFEKVYGYDIVSKLPELFWDLENGEVSYARYNFHDHACERFAGAFADTCGNGCEKNGINLTGHLFGEYTIAGQTRYSGEAMRSYRSFQVPGVDMLFNNREYSTVKQVQSACHQYGREGAMSECYGVTNWDFDFRGHKFQGDWQAALGITMRVPHLSWVSMKGAAKRDYPASINYQSPWYKEYSYIEDHFARLNTVLTRGKTFVNVGVIHPVESYWMYFGPESTTGAVRANMDTNFENLVSDLLFETIDFDLICESSLGELGNVNDGKFNVGKMSYSAILVPECKTLRKTTIDLLERFVNMGGKVVFAGDKPLYIDAKEDERINDLYDKCYKCAYNRFAISQALAEERIIEIKDADGKNPGQFIYQLRKDNDADYLFISNANPKHNLIYNYATEPPCSVTIRIKGEYYVSFMNTFTGEIEGITFTAKDGYTVVEYDFYENDSLLLKLIPKQNCNFVKEKIKTNVISTIDFKKSVTYKRHEDNVCLLDLAEYSLDDGEFEPTEEILRIDKALRERFSWPQASGQDMQPWAIEREDNNHTVTLRFEFESTKAFENTYFCAEELIELNLNGENVALNVDGYYVDKSIKRYKLPALQVGKNKVLTKIAFTKYESLEACYLTGDFDVVLQGIEKTLTPSKGKIGFGDITGQGLAFYGGNITYSEKINVPEKCNLCVNAANYKGALVKVLLDGKDVGNIVFFPYDLHIENVEKGEHTIEFVLYGNRHNTFGGLHNCGISIYYGQGYWYSTDNSWSYEYNLKPSGILRSPVITMHKNVVPY